MSRSKLYKWVSIVVFQKNASFSVFQYQGTLFVGDLKMACTRWNEMWKLNQHPGSKTFGIFDLCVRIFPPTKISHDINIKLLWWCKSEIFDLIESWLCVVSYIIICRKSACQRSYHVHIYHMPNALTATGLVTICIIGADVVSRLIDLIH